MFFDIDSVSYRAEPNDRGHWACIHIIKAGPCTAVRSHQHLCRNVYRFTTIRYLVSEALESFRLTLHARKPGSRSFGFSKPGTEFHRYSILIILKNRVAMEKLSTSRARHYMRKLAVSSEPGLTNAQLMLTNYDLKPGIKPLWTCTELTGLIIIYSRA